MDDLLTRREVERLTGLSCTTIYRKMRAGSFPIPIKISERSVRWYASEIREYRETRQRATGEAA